MRSLSSLRRGKRPSTPKPVRRLWELEDVYACLLTQISSHEHQVEHGHDEGRSWLDSDGEISDPEFGLLQNSLEDLRFMRDQLAHGYIRAGGDPHHLQTLIERNREFRRDLDAAWA
jgi:hypothetical protein